MYQDQELVQQQDGIQLALDVQFVENSLSIWSTSGEKDDFIAGDTMLKL